MADEVWLSSNGQLVTNTGRIATGALLQQHLVNESQPADSGMNAWAYDPAQIRNTKLAVNGTLYLVKLPLRHERMTILNIFWAVTTAGATPTTNQNWAGLYSSAGALLGSSNIDSKVDDGPGLVEGNIASIPGLTVAGPGYVYAAVLFNALVPPTLGCATTTAGFANVGLEAFAPRFATGGTGLTSLPASVVGSIAAAPDAIFASSTAI